jgi:hypothetical protein
MYYKRNFAQLKCVPKFTEDHISFMKSIGFTPFRERDRTVFAFTKNLSQATAIIIRNDVPLNVFLSVEVYDGVEEVIGLSESFGIIQLLLENGIVSCTD